ncbi:MAG: glycosyltransferase family 4 protein [Candidatus Devosia phytovorans]|uniref:Glycosyltransferase family 4 protein n=1 Tax=Candidatus Devosia phytovorans TaxID=3121372 RepID=A0AAJ5VSY5_9HYPH|nr:glycosyltransferase family 4 protein [Devosia sp.]WEK03732.1 MAG: glycosyltransferase family 4 protein [Devosia sp.]
MKSGSQIDHSAMRVLVVTEHASDRFGGEASLPLHIFRKLRARGIEAWMITHARTRDELQIAIPDQLDRVHFVPDTWINKLTYRLGKFLPAQIAYFSTGYVSRLSSQITTRRLARKMVGEQGVTIVHQPIPVSPREPSLLHDLGAPMVMGPLNGGMSFPPGFSTGNGRLGALSGVIAAARYASGALHQLMPGKLRAETLLVANERTRLALPQGCRGKVITLIENGVDLTVWSPPERTTRTAEQGPARFVFIGRLVDWKAVNLLLEAFARSFNDGSASLTIVGDGPMRNAWQEQARALGLDKSVRFTGWLSQKQASAILADSDVLVLPSLYEAGGAVVLEAMASGLPVIATNWGGPRDYLDESCGILVDPRDHDSFIAGLTAAMQRLAGDAALRQSMGRAAAEKVSNGTLNWDRKIERLLEIYEQTVQSAKR